MLCGWGVGLRVTRLATLWCCQAGSGCGWSPQHTRSTHPPSANLTWFTCAGLLDAALAHDDCSLVLTTYEQLRLQRDLLLPVRWGVAVLDEGHKIRNPDAEVRAPAGWDPVPCFVRFWAAQQHMRWALS